MWNEEKKKDLETALSQIERQYGKGAIMRMDASSVSEAPVVSAGNLGLDIALGVGGYPRGRIVEIYGPEASGKTTMALCASLRCKKPEVLRLLLMRNMHLTETMPGFLGSRLKTFWSLSLIMENRLWKLRNSWFELENWTLL